MDTSSYLSLFLQECRDNCAGAVQILLRIEQTAATEKDLQELMRLCHSCKGAAATMEFTKMADLFHRMEDLFAAALKDHTALTAEKIDELLQQIDAVEAALRIVESTGKEPDTFSAQTNDGTVESLETSFNTDLPHVRVESRKLDALLDLSSELSLLKQQFRTMAESSADKEQLIPLVDSLEKNVKELFFHVNQSRLIRLDQAFIRFPRLIRDLAKSIGKEVHFEMEGVDIELDKSVIDHLTTPLIHLLRNAVDHGIETPDEREKAGKPREGRVTIRIRREAGYIVVSVEDDGKQITVEAIRETAAKRGFSAQEVQNITDSTIIDVLCSANFSETEKVTMVSGRGVGLSAVKSTADALGGKLSLIREKDSKRFELVLPLNLSVIQVIFVRVGGHVYGVPLMHVERLLDITDKEVIASLGGEAIDFEEHPLPLIALSQALGLQIQSEQQAIRPVLVIKDPSGLAGITVDEILQNEEVMIKPVSSTIGQSKFYSGCSLLGDGTVALILDIPSILKHSISRP